MKDMEEWDSKQVQDWIKETVLKPTEDDHRPVILKTLQGVTGASLKSLGQEEIRNGLSQSGLSFILSCAFAKRIIDARNKFLRCRYQTY